MNIYYYYYYMVMTTIRDKLQKATNPLRDEFQKFRNPYRKAIDDRWGQYLSNDDRREIARYLADNKDIIESYLGPINGENEDEGENKDKVYKLLKYIETFSIYRQLQSQQPQLNNIGIDKYTVYDYLNKLNNLDRIIEKINKRDFSPLPQHPNVAKPNKNYIEIVFGINGDPKKQKETLIGILKKIGKIMVRGYPASYYDPTFMYNNVNPPLIYYIQLNNDKFFIRFFINYSQIPPKTTGYLLHELSNIIQPKRKSLILPGGNQYYIIKDYLGRDSVAIDQNPNTDPYILQSLRSFYEHQEF